jgi:hypothetical protein
MNASLAVPAYAACGFLIVLYAWVRSTRPAHLVLLLLLYAALGGPLLAYLPGVAHRYADGLTLAKKITHLQLLTVGVTVWLLVRHALFSRAADSAPRLSEYLGNSIIAVAIGAGISVGFHAGDADPLTGAGRDLRVILFSFPLCLAVAFFRDHRSEDAMVPAWLRRAETSLCTSVMTLGLALLYLGQLFPFPTYALHGWRLAATLAVPSALALVIVGCVPHVYCAQGAGVTGAAKQPAGGYAGRSAGGGPVAVSGHPVL